MLTFLPTSGSKSLDSGLAPMVAAGRLKQVSPGLYRLTNDAPTSRRRTRQRQEAVAGLRSRSDRPTDAYAPAPASD